LFQILTFREKDAGYDPTPEETRQKRGDCREVDTHRYRAGVQGRITL
jgi:hypothetical protein